MSDTVFTLYTRLSALYPSHIFHQADVPRVRQRPESYISVRLNQAVVEVPSTPNTTGIYIRRRCAVTSVTSAVLWGQVQASIGRCEPDAAVWAILMVIVGQ